MARLNIINRNEGQLDANGKKKAPNWQYRFEGAKVNGKRKQYSKAGFRTKKEAEIAGTKAMNEYLNTGKNFEPTELSVADFLDYWIKTDLEVNLSDNTTYSYVTVINNHIKPALGHYKLRAIDTMALQEFMNSMASEGCYAKSYLETFLKVLKQGFKYAHKKTKFIPLNPAEDITLPNTDAEEAEIIILTKEQVGEILDRFRRSPYQYYAILTAYYTGLRVGEVYGLTWDDIDFEKKTLTVNKAAKKFDYNAKKNRTDKGISGKAQTKWYLGACKTKSSYRTISIGDTLINALLDYKELQEENKKAYGDQYTHTYLHEQLTRNSRKVKEIIQSTKPIKDLPEVNMVFVKENGSFTGTDSMKYPSKVINDKICRFKVHALRHTHATSLIENDVPIKTVSERLGHANVQITWDIYVKVTEKMEETAVQAFEESNGLKFRDEELYSLWKLTLNKKNIKYYKDRGIKVCDEWLDWKTFEEWSMANGYASGLRLLRVDKTGDYTPDNCMFGTESKSVRGEYIYADGENMKSYSIRKVGRSWQYRITHYTEYGVRKDISKCGFATENDAALAAEELICDMFNRQELETEKPVLRLVK